MTNLDETKSPTPRSVVDVLQRIAVMSPYELGVLVDAINAPEDGPEIDEEDLLAAVDLVTGS